MKRGLVWFTEDLRVDDNETLLKAIEENEEVLPIYFLPDNSLEQLDIPRIGNTRMTFIKESLNNLRAQLQQIGGDLLVIEGAAETQIASLCKLYNIRKVYTKKQVGSEEKTAQQSVKQQLLGLGIDFETYSTSTLFHPDDLPFSVRDIPMLFTKFRKLAEKESVVREPFDAPHQITCPTIESTPFTSETSSHAAWLHGGEIEAQKRMRHFIWDSQAIRTYKETRDQLAGLDFSSKFSSWLSQGCISPRRIYSEIKRFEREVVANESTYWVIFELLWRDFFRFSFKKYPNAYFQLHGLGQQARYTDFDSTKFEAWTHGKTSEALINAGMNELRETGFVSNRMRQILASYWVFGMQQDWRYGAAWFEYCLVDYDVASNWGNWAYIAGVGNDNRGGREFNVEKQALLYDKDGSYRALWGTNGNFNV
ncbi:MAG: DASH family cryptochrome [Flavobacteriales bacterium]|jgi:deoxyribodipyrimidine photo-lyase